MKLIIAIIQPSKFAEVRDELYKSEVNLLLSAKSWATEGRRGSAKFTAG